MTKKIDQHVKLPQNKFSLCIFETNLVDLPLLHFFGIWSFAVFLIVCQRLFWLLLLCDKAEPFSESFLKKTDRENKY